MVLLSKDQKIKLQKLYTEKKFAELELEIESISNFKDRSAFLSNLLGVTKLKKDSKTDKDWNDAKELFLDAHNKDPNDIDALCNYANISLANSKETGGAEVDVKGKKIIYFLKFRK